MSLKKSTRQLLQNNARRSTRIWHSSIETMASKKGGTLNKAMTLNTRRRKKVADKLRQSRMKKGC